MMQDHSTAEEAQHNLAAKALTDAVKKCDKNGVPPEVTVQTLISVGVTLLLSCTEAVTPRACLSVWLQQSGVVKLQGMMTHSAELGKPARTV
jgi:hypothetical protein